MYETMMYTVRGFFGSGLMAVSLFCAVAMIIMVLAALSSPSFRGSLEKMRERGGWRGTVADLGGATFKLALIFVLARLFISALNYQATIFERQHGRITERNRSAVLMKWGLPHEQPELSVHHTRKRAQVTRQLMVVEDKDKERVFSETFWKDQERPVQSVSGKMPTLLSTSEQELDVDVEQKSIVSADVSITVSDNPRRLGNANYAGYDDDWKMSYVVANKSGWETDAHVAMPLPAERGIFDRMHLTVNGRDYLGVAETEGNQLVWTVKMAPGEHKTVEFGYSSRGLEYLRYIPRRMSQTGHYRVAMNVKGIPSNKLDYPIGSMPPVENLAGLKGDAYALTWNLDNAMTSYDLGVKLPVAEQPLYHFAALLQESPGGLIMLLLLLIVPALIAGKTVRPEIVAILGATYCLHYTFMGRLADLTGGFAGPFLVSAAVTIALVSWFRTRGGVKDLLARQDPIAFAVMAVFYPLAMVDTDRSSFWMVLFSLVMIAYACALLARYRIMQRG